MDPAFFVLGGEEKTVYMVANFGREPEEDVCVFWCLPLFHRVFVGGVVNLCLGSSSPDDEFVIAVEKS